MTDIIVSRESIRLANEAMKERKSIADYDLPYQAAESIQRSYFKTEELNKNYDLAVKVLVDTSKE